ncbi:MAG: branched-chain amino acid ABC transporter permease [Betaproteobacteria bacterium]|nr:branched-chain amino acid ABC transporter permease [Betaproteobacteria bacterium]
MNKDRYLADYVTLLLVAVVLALVPLGVGDSAHYLRIVTLMLIYMAYAVAFNIIFGHTRQLFLCIGALAGSSAYLSVVLVTKVSLSPWATIPLGIVFAAFLGGAFSYVSVRRGLGVIFVGIVTLVFSLIFHNLILGLRELTNGETGIETKALGVGVLQSGRGSYYVILAVLMASLVLYHLLMRSRAGTAFRAIADDEVAAELVGIDVTFYKVLAASIGSALLGAVGAIYAYYSGFISPTEYALVSVDIVVLVTLLLGGMGTLLGPVLGGVLFAVLDELVRPLGRLNVLVYGVLMIVLVITFRHGLVAALRKIAKVRIP